MATETGPATERPAPAPAGRRFRKATIKDVARHAGVSTTTVSVFVSGRESVCSPETAARIRAAVAELNYTPSSLISGAQKAETRTLGVCIYSPLDPSLLYGGGFFERLWRGVTAQADGEDYALLHYPASVRDAGADRVEPFLDGRVDGVLFHSHENERAGRVAAAGMPVVLPNRSLHLPPNCGAVWVDEAQTVALALSHLWDIGHRRIAHVAGPVGGGAYGAESRRGLIKVDDVAIRRLEEYESWMRARQAHDPALVAYGGSWEGGENLRAIVAGWRSLPVPPTAVFCANDSLAVALVNAAHEAGLRVPADLSVIGVDNSAAAMECRPALTSIDTAMEQVGRESVRCLLRLLRGDPLEECRTALPVAWLVERASTAALKDIK